MMLYTRHLFQLIIALAFSHLTKRINGAFIASPHTCSPRKSHCHKKRSVFVCRQNLTKLQGVTKVNEEISNDEHYKLSQKSSRRQFITSLIQRSGTTTTTAMTLMAVVVCNNPGITHAANDEDDNTNSNNPTNNQNDDQSTKNRNILKGKIDIQSGIVIPDDISTSALYITARPNAVVDVPRAILDGSNGKAPPVLAARFPNVIQFPYEFELSLNDLTVEGSSKLADADNDSTSSASASSSYWWEGKDLVVSARWDTDGIAATRNPTDLVGRGMYTVGKNENIDSNNIVSVQLQGRGFTGKLITGGKQK